MSNISAVNLNVTSNAVIGSNSSNNHQVNGNLKVYDGITLNNSAITQTGNVANTISSPTTFSNSVTLNGGITNNVLQLGPLSLAYNYLFNNPSPGILQYDLPGAQLHFFWDSMRVNGAFSFLQSIH